MQDKREFLKEIPTQELVDDLGEVEADISLCRLALAVGVTTYSEGKPVAERLENNLWMKKVITEELELRGVSVQFIHV